MSYVPLRTWIQTLASRARFSRFITVGAVGALCDMVVLLALVEWAGMFPELAALIEISILVMFALNERWTFQQAGRQGWRPLIHRVGRSHAVRASAVVLQFLAFVAIYRLVFVPVTLFGLDMWLLVAKGVGILLGLLLNYVLETLFTWRVQSA